MDIQDSLLIKITGNDDILIDLSSLPLTTIIFDFNENSNVKVYLNSSKYSVSIEKGDKTSNSEYKYLQNIQSNKWVSINKNDDSLFPSTYLIVIKNLENNQIVYKHFKVNPLTTLDEIQFDNLRYQISKYSQSLLFDNNRKKYCSFDIFNEENNTSIIKQCEILMNNKNIINYSLLNCLNNPIVNLKKNISVSKQLGKQNTKSLIKNMTRSENYYSVNVDIDYDCVENASLKFYLMESYNKLVILKENIDCFSNDLSSSIISYQHAINNTHKGSTINRLNNEIERINKKILLFNETSKFINDLMNKINNIRYNSFLDDVTNHEVKLNDKFNKNVYYRNIYQKLYYPLCFGRNIFGLSNNTYYFGNSYKSTSTLYELYCLIFLIKIIENNDFVLIEEDKNTFIMKLEINCEDIVLNFTNGKTKLKLIYDKLIENYNNRVEDELFHLNNKHDRPDFQILFFDEDSDELKDAIIIDSKCRRKEKIDINTNNKLLETVLDYLQFRYSSLDSSVINSYNAINDIFIFAPDSTLDVLSLNEKFGVHILRLTPQEDMINDESFRVFDSYFKSILTNFIK